MPIVINVGLSRKQSENYNSQGASINITTELDQSLLTRPDELQGAVSELYEQAERALEHQAHGAAHKQSTRYSARQGHANGHNGNGNRQQVSGRGITQSQRKAIFAIADQLGVDPTDEARHEFGIDLDRASIREASKLIDHLKALQGTAPQGSRQ